jgi:predicted nucleotidyltransferase
MYKKVNIWLDLLGLFTKGFNKEFYIREVNKLLKISPRTAQLILEFLESESVLESEIKGKIRVYRLRNNQVSKEYVMLAEIHKRIKLLKNNPIIKEVAGKINPLIKGIGIIFGSYAKGLNHKDSDLDLFIIGDCEEKEIKKIGISYNVEINIIKYSKNILREKISRDFLIKEVLKDHVIIKGLEELIREVYYLILF